MRYIILVLLGVLIIISCDGGGSSGGSGRLVQFSFVCEAQTPDCSSADHIMKRTFGETIEMECTWDCATNTTDYVDTHPQKHSDPAGYTFTFRKVGDGCLEVYDVAQKECLEDRYDNRLGKNW